MGKDTSSIWSMLSGTPSDDKASSSDAQIKRADSANQNGPADAHVWDRQPAPKIAGPTGRSRPSQGDKSVRPSSVDSRGPPQGVVHDPFMATPVPHPPAQPQVQQHTAPPVYQIETTPLRPPERAAPAPKSDSAEVPQWLISKVDDYITDHFYELEAQVQRLQQQVSDVTLQTQKREDKVAEVLQQLKTLIEMQFAETKKGIARDNEIHKVAEQFEDLKREVRVTQADRLDTMTESVDSFRTEMQDYDRKSGEHLEDKLRKRDDATYRFEADLMSIKKSFSSLRLEFQKTKKGQDFKNTSTSVFLLKALDMKPEERKRVLRTLTEQEEKNRGAVQKAEADLREHEKEINQNQTAV